MMVMLTEVMNKTYIMTMFKIINDQDDDCDYLTLNLGQDHGNNCEHDHLQYVDMSEGVDRDSDYVDDDKNDDNVDGHIILEGPLECYKDNFR